jgi:hypothetical protein
MSTTDISGWSKLEKTDTSNATYIAWQCTKDKEKYDPDETWNDDRYPRRYGDYYQSLDEYNNGYKNGKYRNEYYYKWLKKDRLIATISGQLELTQRERARAKGLYHQLPLGEFWGFKEDVAVAVCLYVIEKNDRDKRRGHPNTLKNWQLFIIKQTLGVNRDKIRTNYGKLEYCVRTGQLLKAPQHDKYRNMDRFAPDSDTVEYEQVSEAKSVEYFADSSQ